MKATPGLVILLLVMAAQITVAAEQAQPAKQAPDRDSTKPAEGAGSVRLRFVPGGGPWKGEAPFDGASWTMLGPGPQKGVLWLKARAGIGHRFPVQEKDGVTLFEVRVTAGDDTNLVLEVRSKDGTQTLDLPRDQSKSVQIAGTTYQLRYPSNFVAGNATETPSTDKATIMVTRPL
jgi:hypothetical protein